MYTALARRRAICTPTTTSQAQKSRCLYFQCFLIRIRWKNQEALEIQTLSMESSPETSPVHTRTVTLGGKVTPKKVVESVGKTVPNPMYIPIVDLQRVDSNELEVVELRKPILPLGSNMGPGETDMSNVRIQLDANSAKRRLAAKRGQLPPTENHGDSEGVVPWCW